MAINLSPEGLIRYYPKFPWAIPNHREGSHALLTRLPLSIAGAFDLHVLGLPPAFVLSQDQTLKLKATPVKTDVKIPCIILLFALLKN